MLASMTMIYVKLYWQYYLEKKVSNEKIKGAKCQNYVIGPVSF